MKQPTADDALAACEVVRLYRDLVIKVTAEDRPLFFRDLNRATDIITAWLDQFDEEGGAPPMPEMPMEGAR